MTTKTQDELEQPAKVYQLEAVAKDLLELKNSTKESFSSVNEKLDMLIAQPIGKIVAEQIEASEKKIKCYIDEEIKKVHLTYRPLKSNLRWFYRVVVVGILGMVCQVALVYMKIGG